MSNIIQIKHGLDTPGGKLAPYELGYSENLEQLYIGVPKDATTTTARPISVQIEEDTDNSGGSFIYGNTSGRLIKNNRLILTSGSFGPTFPQDPVEGQVFFVIREEGENNG